jgi:hypothetical protein
MRDRQWFLLGEIAKNLASQTRGEIKPPLWSRVICPVGERSPVLTRRDIQGEKASDNQSGTKKCLRTSGLKLIMTLLPAAV